MQDNMRRPTRIYPVGPLLFLIYINDLPSSCLNLSPTLFADATNLTSIHKSDPSNMINRELLTTGEWLRENKLSLNIQKTEYITFGNQPTRSEVCIYNQRLPERNHVKYLGIHIDSQLNFQDHISYVRNKLAKMAGMTFKTREILNQDNLLLFYKVYAKPVIQYGILVYGATSYRHLEPILILQKRIIRLIYFKKQRDGTATEFISNKILTVHELHIYELLKLLLKSIRNELSSSELNNLVDLNPTPAYNTRRATSELSNSVACRTNFKIHSAKNRVNKLYNILRGNDIIPKTEIIKNMTDMEISSLAHRIRDNYVLGNLDLIDVIFNRN